MTTEEKLRREVRVAIKKAMHGMWALDATDEDHCVEIASNAAFDALRDHYQAGPKEEARPICSADGCHRREPCGLGCRDNGNFDEPTRPAFDGDEAVVLLPEPHFRSDLAKMGLFGKSGLALLDAKDAEIAELRTRPDPWLTEAVRERDTALALLDGKDAKLAELAEALTKANRACDTALSRAEQAEAALAEERKAHQAFREEVSAAIRIWKGANPHFYSHHLSRFILPAKPADPLEAVVNEAWGWRNPHPDVTANLRTAIERAGGTIEFPDALLAQRSKP